MNARRVVPRIKYRDTNIAELVTSISYSDTEDITDDVSISIADPIRLFATDLFPTVGDKLTVGFELVNYPVEGKSGYIGIGSFEVDDFSQGSNGFTINGVTIPITGSARSEKKYKTWENIRLSGILRDIAVNAGIDCIYDSDYDPLYDKKEQSNESDLEFLSSLANDDGMCIKISNGKLVIFDEAAYDEAEPSQVIIRGQSNITGEPSFNCSAKDIYSSCEITFTDSKTDNTYSGSFSAPNDLGISRVLRLRESYNSEEDDINFKRKARAELRSQNKNQWTAEIELIGNLNFYAGTNVQLQGWHRWDGKYHITEATHTLSRQGFRTQLNLRRCLEGY